MVLSALPRSSSAIDARLKLYRVKVPRKVVTFDIPDSGVDRPIDLSPDNGVDNPFRPGSELSREADIIVNMIKEGKPIALTQENSDSPVNGTDVTHTVTNCWFGNGMNGSLKSQEPGDAEHEIQHWIVVPPNDGPSQVVVERVEVMIRKKHKCCVIQ